MIRAVKKSLEESNCFLHVQRVARQIEETAASVLFGFYRSLEYAIDYCWAISHRLRRLSHGLLTLIPRKFAKGFFALLVCRSSLSSTRSWCSIANKYRWSTIARSDIGYNLWNGKASRVSSIQFGFPCWTHETSFPIKLHHKSRVSLIKRRRVILLLFFIRFWIDDDSIG